MILSDRDIRSAIDSGHLGISPFDPTMVQPSSIDVRLDRYFRVFNNARYTHIDPKEEQEDLTSLVEVKEGDAFILHPGEFVLGSTLEEFALPADLAGRLEGKSSLGRLGLLTHSTAGFIDPGFNGYITFNGLSKAYRVAGYRSGWMVLTGPKEHAKGFIEGLDLLASTRLCPNVPAQHAIQVALGGKQSIYDLTLPGGRLLEQRNIAYEKLNEIPGVSVVKPMGALYAFPKLDRNVYDIHDDEQFMFDLLRAEKIHLVQGTGFNWPEPDHFRVVTLPWARDLADAIERLGNFLSSYHQ